MSDELTPRSALPGSERRPVTSAAPGPLVPDSQQLEVTLVLRRQTDLPPGVVATGGLSPADLAASYGASDADIALVRGVIDRAGLHILDIHGPSRRVRVGGPAGLLSKLFGTELSQVTIDTAGGPLQVRGRSGELSLPGELTGVVVAVLGLDDRPQAAPKLRVAPAASRSRSYTPVELARIYDLPAADGAGHTVAIIELGGGFGQQDLTTYFKGLGIATPTVRAVGVDGAVNKPGQDATGADGEVLLDIEVVGGIAPAADIVVYFAPNTDAGFLDAVSTAAHASPTPTAMSISWGQSEDDWTAQARKAMDAAFADAAALGVTVTVAAGDDGSTDRATDGGAHVDFPASSPHVLACGGTNLMADSTTGAVTSETVWNEGPGNGATGGGVSAVFGLPSWQSGVGVPVNPTTRKAGRGVPDVAADADPRTGYTVLIDGTETVIGGTSAVAPLWAGLVARLSQLLGRKLGLLAPQLYDGTVAGQPSGGLRDIITGNNGQYQAGPGWDPCTGLGVPAGTELLKRLALGSPLEGGPVR